MRKLTVVVALVCAVALAAAVRALEVNSLRPAWGVAPSATVTTASYSVLASNPSALPSGIIVFSGAGAEFWYRNWQDLDGDGTWAFEGVAHGVPGTLTLPRPAAERSGDSLFVKCELYCASDSLTYIWTW